MAIAFTFPGQGSQAVGMGKMLAEQFSVARDVFQEVDDALNEKLSDIMFNGPEDTLTLTANAQPALMAVSMAVLRVMETNGLVLSDKVSYVAGHSLGEYSALCAAGTFSLADTARLLRIRGNAMQQAAPVGSGAMAAIIGLDDSQVTEICQQASAQGVCQIANDNGGGQIVISGAKAAVEQACSLASEAGAKRALLLQVSAPFHSAMMQPAAEAMQEALANVTKHDPIVPVIANVSVEPVGNAEQIVDLLVQQVTGRVRWRETVEWFAAHDVDTLFEIGSGKVLSGLAKRINRDMKTVSVTSAQDIDAALEILAI